MYKFMMIYCVYEGMWEDFECIFVKFVDFFLEMKDGKGNVFNIDKVIIEFLFFDFIVDYDVDWLKVNVK